MPPLIYPSLHTLSIQVSPTIVGQEQGWADIGGGGCGMSADTSSPPCYANKGDPGYLGYASNNEIIAALQELLEAERAGARVALVSRSEAEAPDMKNLIEKIGRAHV